MALGSFRVYMIRMFFILIYVLYKSKSLTLELLYIVGNY